MHAEPQTPPEESTVPPGDDSNTDPTPPLPADSGRNGGERPSSVRAAHPQPAADEEPELNTGERDIPSDGRDPEGEGMIRDLDKPAEPGTDTPQGKPHGH